MIYFTFFVDNAFLTFTINVTFPNDCVEKDQAQENVNINFI